MNCWNTRPPNTEPQGAAHDQRITWNLWKLQPLRRRSSRTTAGSDPSEPRHVTGHPEPLLCSAECSDPPVSRAQFGLRCMDTRSLKASGRPPVRLLTSSTIRVLAHREERLRLAMRTGVATHPPTTCEDAIPAEPRRPGNRTGIACPASRQPATHPAMAPSSWLGSHGSGSPSSS